MRAALRLAPITVYTVIRAKRSAAHETSVKLPFSYDCLTCGLSVTPCPGTLVTDDSSFAFVYHIHVPYESFSGLVRFLTYGTIFIFRECTNLKMPFIDPEV